MDILYNILLGIVQGLTEFLPVSSSGHLVLVQYFTGGLDSDTNLEVILHLGSVLAVLIYFRKTIVNLLLGACRNNGKSQRLTLLWLAVSTAVTGVIGVVFKDSLEGFYSMPIWVAVFLLVTGTVLWISDRIPEKNRTMAGLGWLRSLVIGLAQAVAILPGISRSGSTIATSLFTGLERKQAAEYAFLLSIPAILGAAVMDLDGFSNLSPTLWPGYIAGALASFASGWAVIAWLLSIIQRRKLSWFAWYCWVAGLVALVAVCIW